MKKKKTNQELIDEWDSLAGAASAADFTGLIPTPPKNRAELESYKELYPFRPTVSENQETDRSPQKHGRSTNI